MASFGKKSLDNAKQVAVHYPTMRTIKKPTSLRLSVEAMRLLRILSDKMGLPKTGVIETAIRELAKGKEVGSE